MKTFTFLFLMCLLGFSTSAQNSCENAETITEGIYTVQLIDGDPAPINCLEFYENGPNGEWYKYTAQEDYTVTLTTDLTQNAGGDTRFHIYQGPCSNLTCYASDDDSGSGYLSETSFSAFQGMTFYIVFDNNWQSAGFDFELIENEYTPPPEPLVGFTEQTVATDANTLAVVDMDNDFLDDIVSVQYDNLHINFQTEDGFSTQDISTESPQNQPYWSISVADYDANGYNDLIYGGSGGVTFMKANDDGSFYTQTSPNEYIFSQRTNFIDIDNDGFLDAFVCHDIEPNVFFMNDGDGNFDYNQGGLGDSPNGGNYGSIWTDYDNDGDMDMFIAKCRGGNTDININQLHQNNGDGTFTEVASEAGLADPIQTWSAAWGDFDNDGFMDVFVGASSFNDGHHKLMHNNGDGTFSDVSAGSGFEEINSTSRENVTYDFDNDGYLDIYGAGGVIMINNGDMTFTDSQVLIPNSPVGDLNDDGFVDIVHNNTIHLNDGNENNWIKIGVIGNESNRNGIGARIEVYSELGKQIREIRSGTGFEYMNTLNAYFGIGEDTEIEKVIVRWPSGIEDQINGPEINTSLVIEEGNSLLGLKNQTFKNVALYPIPAENELNVESSFQIIGKEFKVYAMDGRQVLKGVIDFNKTLDITNLNSGLYFLKLNSNGKIFQRKFIKK
jgi:hypothetical protein